jgi:hypothetical protein
MRDDESEWTGGEDEMAFLNLASGCTNNWAERVPIQSAEANDAEELLTYLASKSAVREVGICPFNRFP